MAQESGRRGLASWLRGLRFSGFSILMVGVIVIGVVVLAPSVNAFLAQRQRIAELEQGVAATREQIEDVEAERARWKDPAYVRAEARDRLFYVLPGEKQVLVIDDVVLPEDEAGDTSDEVEVTEGDWLASLASSVLIAGTTDATREELGAP